MTLSAIIAVLGGLLPLVLAVMEAIMNGQKNRKANRNALTKAESDELGAGMDAVDRVQPPPR